MMSNIDNLIQAPTSSFPFEVTPTTLKKDPILDFLRDPSATTFDIRHINDINNVNKNISHTDINPSFDFCQHSTTVNPVYIVPSTNNNQTSSKEQLEYQSIKQCDYSKSGKIQIKNHPRTRFRPRTEKESKESSHYLRCEDNTESEYPTIDIPKTWSNQTNIIRVTLVGIDKQPHPYTIDNKERNISSLVFKEPNEPHSLYFFVTKEDYDKGEKSFLIEYIKHKQDDKITKDLIKSRQLNQSMLQFTRFYLIEDGSYLSDETSIEYSHIMTEHYGDVTIEDIFPLYGPMCGNQKVCIELKGPITKNYTTDFIITISCKDINWSHQVQNIKRSGHNLIFLMPSFPHRNIARAKVDIIIVYKQEIIQQSNYVYTKNLDGLNENSGNESNRLVVIRPSSSDNCNQILGGFSTWSSTGMSCENRAIKRPRQ
ncbi:unnamed protein product [Rotaria sp. Silwood1]|nr:unnamed protein product [Rotaria sp. Silwood1]